MGGRLSVQRLACTCRSGCDRLHRSGRRPVRRSLDRRPAGLVDRFGQPAVARSGGLVVAAGVGIALAFPTLPGTIIGFAAAGLGVATLVPGAMHEADELPSLRPGTGLTIVSWLMRLGFLLSPPVVGAVANATELRFGLLIVPAVSVLVILLAGVLEPRRRATDRFMP